MRFTNENGEVMNLADNLTLHELLDMGVSISVSEETDPDQQHRGKRAYACRHGEHDQDAEKFRSMDAG